MTTSDGPSTVAVPADLWRAILDHLIRAPYCDMNPTINPRAAVPADRDFIYWRAACEATQAMGSLLYRKASTVPDHLPDNDESRGHGSVR